MGGAWRRTKLLTFRSIRSQERSWVLAIGILHHLELHKAAKASFYSLFINIRLKTFFGGNRDEQTMRTSAWCFIVCRRIFPVLTVLWVVFSYRRLRPYDKIRHSELLHQKLTKADWTYLMWIGSVLTAHHTTQMVQFEATWMPSFIAIDGGLEHCVYCLSIRLTLTPKHLGANKLRYPALKSCECRL
jgi:hypothetical protein